MRGPNYWSTHRKQLIVLKLGLSGDNSTNNIPGFHESLLALVPSLQDHRCTGKKRGGFMALVKEGTSLAHVVEHLALELQCLAGMQCGFGRTRNAREEDNYEVVFNYQLEKAGRYAATAAIHIVQQLAAGKPVTIEEDIQELIRLNSKYGLGPSTQSIVNAAKRKKIPWRRLDDGSLVMLGQGVHQKIINATVASSTSGIGIDLASDKEETKLILKEGHIPVPEGNLVYEVEELEAAIEALGFPLVIKPYNSSKGRGITTNLVSREEVYKAFEAAKNFSRGILLERFIKGHDFRFLVVNYKLEAVARRTPAMIVGNGSATIQQLVEATNQDPNRGEGHEKILTKIILDEASMVILSERGLTPASVLADGEMLFLKGTANLSTGGTARDCTDIVHPQNVFLAERAARLIGLDICGLDVVAEDISQPITTSNGAFIEVNAAPGFRMHLSPTKGMARNVAEPVVNMLFPDGTPSRIPLIAVTGTNGKTTVTRLTAHFARQAGHNVGYTTTDGIYINGNILQSGDCSGPNSAQTILRDPLVDFAVLETARGGILRAGLGFDQCNISILTNISEDHLGLSDIHTIEELAKVKSVVLRSTAKEGYAILNADDDIVYGLKDELDCNIALFSTRENNERVQSHCEAGGWAAIIERGYFTICQGEWRTRLGRVNEVPLTHGGRAQCMIQNILPAILAATLSNIDIRLIRKGMQSFVPGPEFTPGRMNIFPVRDFEVMVDYVHNTDGFDRLKEFMMQVNSPDKVGIIACAGDRRDLDIIYMGKCAAEIFDRIIIRHDRNGRGRSNENLTMLLKKGIESVRPEAEITVISDETEALGYAIDNADRGTFIVLASDEIQKSIEYVMKRQKHGAAQPVV